LLTPWILFPVTGHLGPLALFFVYWYTNFPPNPRNCTNNHKQANKQLQPHNSTGSELEIRHRRNEKKRRARERDLTWGLDNPGLVGFGGIAMPLTVCQPLNHLAPPPGFSVLSPYPSMNYGSRRTLEDRSLGFIKGRLVHYMT
jgi:hypothetical protein